MKDNPGIYLNFPFVSGLILLLPLTMWIIAIVIKVIGADYLFDFIIKPVGVDNISYAALYIFLASLVINFIPIIKLNLKEASIDTARENIYRLSLIHAGIMALTLCYSFILIILCALEMLGNIPVGRG